MCWITVSEVVCFDWKKLTDTINQTEAEEVIAKKVARLMKAKTQ